MMCMMPCLNESWYNTTIVVSYKFRMLSETNTFQQLHHSNILCNSEMTTLYFDPFLLLSEKPLLSCICVMYTLDWLTYFILLLTLHLKSIHLPSEP